MTNRKLNWGILGRGSIAREMGAALNAVNGEIYAVCGTTLEGAEKFAKEFGVTHAYGNADDMMNDPHVDIVYIATYPAADGTKHDVPSSRFFMSPPLFG